MHDCEFCGNEIDYHEIIDCITCALDARDPYTAGHSERVSDMVLKVCQLIGLKKEDTLKIHIAAHLHDIGKIGVPDAVLTKEGKLTDEAFAYIKKHPIIGARIIAICDSIDAITSNRCYRKAHDFDYCYQEIEKNLGKMYEMLLVILIVLFSHQIKYILNNW